MELLKANAGEKVLARDEVLLDLHAKMPLKIFAFEGAKIQRMQQDGWDPPLRLTSKKQEVINIMDTCLLLGRSCTSKTICITSKMAVDCQALLGKLQLCVTRSQRICRMVGTSHVDLLKCQLIPKFMYIQ